MNPEFNQKKSLDTTWYDTLTTNLAISVFTLFVMTAHATQTTVTGEGIAMLFNMFKRFYFYNQECDTLQ